LRSTTRSTPSYGRLTSSQSSLKSENKFQKRKRQLCIFLALSRLFVSSGRVDLMILGTEEL
jgi:hypothetical protein